MSGISDKAINKQNNQNKFNGGVELEEDYGVNLYCTFHRQYDPQLGRFGGVDILGEQTAGVSGYQFSGNNPLSFNDPMGDKYQDPSGETWHHADGLAGTLAGGTGYEAGFGWDGFGGGFGGPGGETSDNIRGGSGGDYSAFWSKALPGLMSIGGPNANTNVVFRSAIDRNGNNVIRFNYFTSIDNGYGSMNGEVIGNQITIQNGKTCYSCLNPSTIGNNYIGTYPGPNNPTDYMGNPNYSFIPMNPAEYPAIGHDRRYDNLKISGASGLFMDARSIGADWQFVGEELKIAASNIGEIRADTLLLGIGLGASSLTKTLVQLYKGPIGVMEIVA